jgi:hypothetical protein
MASDQAWLMNSRFTQEAQLVQHEQELAFAGQLNASRAQAAQLLLEGKTRDWPAWQCAGSRICGACFTARAVNGTCGCL